MFCREAVIWKYLDHPNILPLLGATISPPQLISVFMPAGDLSKYIEENPNADRIRLVGAYLVVSPMAVLCSLQQLVTWDRGWPLLPAFPQRDPWRS